MPLDFEKALNITPAAKTKGRIKEAMKTDAEMADPGKPEDFDGYYHSHGIRGPKKTDVEDPISGVITVDPMDPAPLLKHFDKWKVELKTMIEKAKAVKIVDDESMVQASEMDAQALKIVQVVNKKHKGLKARYLRVTNPLDAIRKGVVDNVGIVRAILAPKITARLLKKKRDQDEINRLAQIEADKLQVNLGAEAQEEADALRKKLEAENKPEEAAAVQIIVPPMVVAQVESELKIHTPSGSAKLATKWTWTVENFKLIPDEIIEMRKKEIKEALGPAINPRLKMGIRKIPGIRIFEVTTSETRTNR